MKAMRPGSAARVWISGLLAAISFVSAVIPYAAPQWNGKFQAWPGWLANAGADADGVGARVGEIRPAGANQLIFQLAFAAHQQLLHFFGCFVLVVLAQVAVAARHRYLAGIGRDGFLDHLVILVLAPLQTV